MKNAPSPRGGRFLPSLIAVAGMTTQAFCDPKLPHGNLNIDSALVRVGAQSQLQWDIQYPSKITDEVDVLTPNILSPKKDLKMRVRVLGSSFRDLRTNAGHGNNVDGVDSSNPGKGGPGNKTDTDSSVDDEISGSVLGAEETDYPVEVVWSKNSAPWTRIFYGNQSSIVPTAVVLNTKVARGDTIDFGARGFLNDWLPLYSTVFSTPNVVILKNGDPVPANIASYRIGLTKGFLKPFLSSDLKTLKLGENDFIVLMELDQSDPNKTGFDLQDLAVLVTFD